MIFPDPESAISLNWSRGRGDVVSLGVGEPDFSAPWHIREAAIWSLEKGETSYTSNLGLPKLREEISAYVAGHLGPTYDPGSEILVTVGVSEALDIAFRALIDPGDEVIYHDPCYVSYDPSIALAQGTPVPVPTLPEDNFALRADAVAERITGRTVAIVLNFPTNPTGATIPDEELEAIARLCVAHDLVAISDEIYSELLYDGAGHTSISTFPGMRERTLVLHGFSKAFAMTGFRLGYACGPSQLIDAMMKVHQYAMMCAPITSQVAAIEALQHGADSVAEMHRAYIARRNLVLTRFEKMGLPCPRPGGAFYVFPDIRPTGLTSKEFALGLLEAENVAVVPGDAFGACGEGFVRCC